MYPFYFLSVWHAHTYIIIIYRPWDVYTVCIYIYRLSYSLAHPEEVIRGQLGLPPGVREDEQVRQEEGRRVLDGNTSQSIRVDMHCMNDMGVCKLCVTICSKAHTGPHRAQCTHECRLYLVQSSWIPFLFAGNQTFLVVCRHLNTPVACSHTDTQTHTR